MTDTNNIEKELICSKKNIDCDTGVNDVKDDNIYNCCYNFTSKLQEFLHKDAYMLDYKNTIKRDENNDRIKVLYSKIFQAYSVLPSKKIDKTYKDEDKEEVEYNQKYFNTFGIIPLELIPASYIPFNYKNYEMNLDRLSKGDIFFEDDYKKIFLDYNKQPDPNSKTYINEKNLKEYLEICLKDRLSNPKAIYNAYSINIMTMFVCVLWFYIIIMMLYIVFYYYRDIYSYILLGITIILVLIAIIWKMIYILNID
jgi:hypothetical protein